MSNNVDRRIVEMQFDNKQFETHAQTSIETLDKLKKSLDLKDSAKGLTELDKAAKSVNLDSLVGAAEAVSSKFSIIGTVADQVFRRITDAALNAAAKVKGFIEELTIKPVSTGFEEYETQINAIQTIMSNTRDKMTAAGYSEAERLEIVNDRLDQLNHYADKTIYNFTEMTRNIGTFTAAGVELDTAVNSIQGIANLAAVSGSTSEQASRGMYQLSQAISTGTVKLMDWNSVVNAGMGGEVFQKALLRTADAMGVTVDATVTTVNKKGKKVKETVRRTASDCVEAAGSFRESLSSGWLTADVLTATLEQFSWDFEQMAKDTVLDDETRESYIAQLAERYIGDGMDAEAALEKAKTMIGEMTNLSVDAVKELKKADLLASGYTLAQANEIIALAEDAVEAATKVKTFTQLFDTLKEAAQSGWTQTWKYIIGDFEEAKELLTSISDFFGGIIDASSEARNQVVSGWKDLGGRDELIASFWNVVYSIQNIANMIRGEFQNFFPPKTSEQLYSMTQKFREFTEKLKSFTENSETMEKFRRIVAGVAAAFDMAKKGALWAWSSFKKLLGVTGSAASGLMDVAAGIGDFFVNARNSIGESKILQSMLGSLGEAATTMKALFSKTFSKIGNTFSALWGKLKGSDILTKLSAQASAFISRIPGVIQKIQAWGKAIIDYVKNSQTLKKAWNTIQGLFSSMFKSISNFIQKIREVIRQFFSTDTSDQEGIWEKLKTRFSTGFSSLTDWFEDAKGKALEGWNTLKTLLVDLFTNTIPAYLSDIKMKAINKWPWLESVFGYFETAFAKIKAFCAPLIEKFQTAGQSIRDAVRNLFGPENKKDGTADFGKSIIDWVKVSWENIKGAFSEFFGKTIPTWIEKLKEIDWESILKPLFGLFTAIKLIRAFSGIGKLGNGLSSLGTFLQDISKNGLTITQVTKNKDSFAESLLKIAKSIAIMVTAIVVLANMDTKKALKGIYLLGAIALELLAITALFKMIAGDGASMLKAASAVALMTIPIYLLGNMDAEAAWRGVVRTGAVMLALATAMKIAGSATAGKQSFIQLAVAVNLLVIAVKMLGNMDLGAAAQGIIGLGAILLELSLFMRFTESKKIKGILSLAVGINLLVRAVRNLGKMKIEELGKGIAGLSVILLAFAVLIKSVGSSSFLSSIGSLALMVGSMLAFSFALKNIEGIPWQTIAAFSAGIVAIGLAMSLIVGILNGIGVAGAANAAAALVIIAAGIGVAIAALAGLVGGAVSGFTDDMVRVGANLSAYSNSVSGLNITAIQSSIGVLEDLAAVAAKITVTDTSGFEAFASQISLLGARLSLFSALTAGVDPINFSNAKTAVEDITSMAEKMTAMQEKSIDLGALGEALTIFGSGIQLYAIACEKASGLFNGSEGAEEIDATKISDLFSALGEVKIDESAIATVSSYAKGGGNDLTSFALGLTAIGNALEAYQTSIQGISLTDSVKAGLTLNMINQLQQNLPRDDNSFISWVAGEKQTLSNFSDNIALLGAGLSSFSGSLTSDTTNLSERGVAVVKALSDIQNELPRDGGIAHFFAGAKDLSSLGTNLITLGTGFSQFVSSLDGFKGKDAFVGKAVGVIDSLAEIQSKLDTTNGVAQWFTGSSNIGTFGENLNTFASKFSGFCNALSSVTIPKNIDSISDVVDEFANIAVKMNGLNPYDISDYIKWIGVDLNTFFGNGSGGIGGITVDETKLASIVSFVDSIAGVIVTLNGLRSDDYGFMQGLLDGLAELSIPEVVSGGMEAVYTAIQNGKSQFARSISQLISAGEKAARSTYSNWHRVGQQLSIGISNGIVSMAGSVRRAAINTASGAIRAISITWAVHSPSRVGRELGMNLDLGIAEGIGDYSRMVSAQATNMSESAVTAAKSMLTGADSSIFDCLDPTPTIRPVLDLSNVQSGISTIGDMFTSSSMMSSDLFQGVSFNRNAGMLNFDGAKILGSQNNKDVVGELRVLSDRFNTLSEAVTNMQLVLDTGVLVGQTSARMDRQLGVQAMRRGRGN